MISGFKKCPECTSGSVVIDTVTVIIFRHTLSSLIMIFSFLATPGRLNDLQMNELIDLRSITYLVCYYS